jgi:hypothetical protein
VASRHDEGRYVRAIVAAAHSDQQVTALAAAQSASRRLHGVFPEERLLSTRVETPVQHLLHTIDTPSTCEDTRPRAGVGVHSLPPLSPGEDDSYETGTRRNPVPARIPKCPTLRLSRPAGATSSATNHPSLRWPRSSTDPSVPRTGSHPPVYAEQ